jgi:hypothetical protein
VWIADGERAAKVAVEAGDALGDRVVIRSGLAAGARVVLGTAPQREGQKLRATTAGG